MVDNLKIGILTQSEAKCADALKDAITAFEEENADIMLNTCAAKKVKRKGLSNNEIKADIYVLVGNDRFILNFLLTRPNEEIKMLPVSPIDETGFLSEINISDLEPLAKYLFLNREQDYNVKLKIANVPQR